MTFLGNLLWLLLGGLLCGLLYIGGGVLMCVTLVGIPFGIKIIRLGFFAFCPFGRKVEMNPADGCLSTFFNILWVLTGWWEIALLHLIFGVVLCITIIGIPFGKQHFKIARYSLFPFGCEIKRD